MIRPKDMTPPELDALPEVGPGGTRFTILEVGVCAAVERDDIAFFTDSKGRCWHPVSTPDGWGKTRVSGL